MKKILGKEKDGRLFLMNRYRRRVLRKLRTIRISKKE